MERDHNFEELAAPAQAAEDLNISVATLRKYSLLVEKVTGNKDYYERTKQKARLYSEKDIADLKAFQHLAKDEDLTLQEAAQQIFAISNVDGKQNDSKKADHIVDTLSSQANQGNTMVDAKQVIKLLTILQNTITSQNKAIQDLQKQVARVEEQNRKLIDSSHQLSQPTKTVQETQAPQLTKSTQSEVQATMPKLKTEAEKKKEEMAAEIEADKQKSDEEMHDEIMEKTRENQEKQAEAIHRTLAQMQVQPRRTSKKHWWQRIFK
ncbi:MerR family transcriptional regulator [Lactobacillus sp.]|uniref:MerR family transcriptional regulator n=1 Tax=Lactobacillus sp. TaxID=1591 RepID=UPI00198A30FA|nr:MerR family transcriptional regulator [Lactobacillus sp.]MBD5430014.1 MerR family transcriptional regulator [Lactobacillus sp.]MBD5430469.1 MerR family transcriptional regulator [Lactobacillus sp.]